MKWLFFDGEEYQVIVNINNYFPYLISRGIILISHSKTREKFALLLASEFLVFNINRKILIQKLMHFACLLMYILKRL